VELELTAGSRIQEYRIEKTLGVGGFGLTYLATDSNLDVRVAIKEYLPGDLAVRADDGTVKPKSADSSETFQWGLERFLDESRTVASFRHPNIVRVMRFFQANSTAYMVMEFVNGLPLADWIGPRRPITAESLLSMVGPLLDGLETIHRSGYLHRDIKPGNIFIREDGSPVLIDFGSARNFGAQTGELTAIVSPGYAPLEQYHAHGRQGPWSDLYALGGVMYWMVTGNKPVEAAARVRQDVLVPALQAADRGRYGVSVLAAIDWALTPDEAQRPQSAQELRSALLGAAAADGANEIAFEPAAPVNSQPTSATVLAQARFDPELLKRLEAELAKHLGPIAAVVLKSAAKRSFTQPELVATLAGEISDAAARTAFEKRFAGGDKSTPSGAPARATTRVDSLTALAKFDPVTLARAESDLARHIGAVAKVVIRRAAAKARDESELYLLIAEEISDKEERKAFVRKAISVSAKK